MHSCSLAPPSRAVARDLRLRTDRRTQRVGSPAGGWRESSAAEAPRRRHRRELGSRDRDDIAVVFAQLPGPLVADGTRAKVHMPIRWCGWPKLARAGV